MVEHKVKTNHAQYGAEAVYCYRIEQVLDGLTQEHMATQCQGGCPFFAGSYQGKGVECLYYDGTNQPIDLEPDPYQLEEKMSVYKIERV